MPGSGGVDEIEGLAAGVPGLEGSDDDADFGEGGEVAAGDGGEVLAQLDAGNCEAAPGERESGAAGSAADLEQVRAGWELRESDQVYEELLGQVRTSAVIGFGN